MTTVPFNSLTKYLRIPLAGFMSVWLSGVVFLFCCQEMSGRSGEAVAGFMPAVAGHCDKARQRAANETANVAESAAVLNIQTDRIDCCGLLPAVFDKVRKLEKDQQQVAVAAEVPAVKFHPPAMIGGSPPPASVSSAAVPPEKIFIKNCVFRI